MTDLSLLNQIDSVAANAPFDNVEALELAAHSIQIQNRDDFLRAGTLLKQISDGLKSHEAHWEPLRAAAHELKEAVLDRINAKSVVGNKIKAILSTKMSDYRLEQERRRKQQEEEAAQKHQESLQEAQKASHDLILSGRPAEGIAVLQKARLTVPMVSTPDLRLDGLNQVPEYTITVVDFKEFCREVIDGNVPSNVLETRSTQPVIGVRISALKELKKSMGSSFQIKGVEVKEKYGYRSTGK